MSVEQSVGVGAFPGMAVQAHRLCEDRVQLSEGTNLRAIHRIGVFLTRPVTRFARTVGRSVDLHILTRMGIGHEIDTDVFMTQRTQLRAGVLGIFRRKRRQRLL